MPKQQSKHPRTMTQKNRRWGWWTNRFLAVAGAVSLFIISLLAVGILWFYPGPTSPRSDDTPLPQGPVQEPLILSDYSTSNLRFHFKASLASLQRILNKSVPLEFPVPKNEYGATGTIRRGDIQISAQDATRLRLDSAATFVGSVKQGPGGIIKLKSAKVDLAGSTLGLSVAPDWDWLIAPRINAKLTAVNVDWLPDNLVKWLANEFIVPHITSGFSNSPPFAFRPLVDSFWNDANQDIQIFSEPRTSVELRPQAVTLGGPLLERDGSLVMTVGLDVHSRATIGSTSKASDIERIPLPSLNKASVANETTELRLPILVSLQAAPRFFQPQTLEIPGGTVKILSVDLSEKEGICYIRGRVRFEVGQGQAILRPFSGETTLIVQGRPSCDPDTGEISFRELAFTPKSDSILVQILGESANSLRQELQELAPILSGWVKNRLESQLNAEAEKFLTDQIQTWASAVPDFEDEIRTIIPTIKNIRIKPIRLETTTGHFVLVIQANADLGIAIP